MGSGSVPNAAPVVTVNGFTMLEGSVVNVTKDILSVTDADDALETLSFTLTGLTDATLFRDSNYNGVVNTGETIGLGQSFSYQDIVNGVLKIRHNGDQPASNVLSVAVSDGTTRVTGSHAFTVTNVNDAPTGLPSITGAAQRAGVLHAVTTGVQDADLFTSNPPSFTYQWKADGADISGATGSSYTVARADIGKKITVLVGYTDAQGHAESVFSLPTDVVIIDLEDSVAPSDKAQARANVIEAIGAVDWGRKTLSVRINGLDTPYWYRDVVDLLEQAGWTVQDGLLRNAKGEVFRIEFLDNSGSMGRVVTPYAKNLEKLGFEVQYKVIDFALLQKRMDVFDFDIISNRTVGSEAPGTELLERFGSKAADTEGSGNVIGIKNAAVDALLDKAVSAQTRPQLVAALRALDRVLRHGHYVVLHWYGAVHRVAWRAGKFGHPQVMPLYYQPEAWVTSVWWSTAASKRH